MPPDAAIPSRHAARDAPAVPPVGAQDFRSAMAHLAAAVHVITTDGPAGRAGFTASAVCSVTDAPPTLLVCLNRGSSAHAAVRANGVICVNTLAAGQEEISAGFGGGLPAAERFTLGSWRALATGAPLLEGALASFDCRIAEVAEVGTHSVLFCEVLGIAEGGAGLPSLVYLRRGYRHL